MEKDVKVVAFFILNLQFFNKINLFTFKRYDTCLMYITINKYVYLLIIVIVYLNPPQIEAFFP